MSDEFGNFMKKEVIKYIKEELDKGISLQDVKSVLIKHGHKLDLIEEATLELLKHNFDLEKALKEPIKDKTLAQEMYAEILSSLIDYIEFQKKQGYKPKEIKQILLQQGHSEDILNSAIKSVEKGANSNSHFGNIRFLILLFLMVIFVLWVGSQTGDDISKILTGFFPAIATLVVIGIMGVRIPHKQQVFLWLLPFIFSGVFLILAQSGQYSIFESMQVISLTFLNVILALIITVVLINPTKIENEP